MQKEEGGHICIDVKVQQADPMLVITITDDGIGRAKSTELKTKTATKHKSYGMKITSARLALTNKNYMKRANVFIEDLTGNNGEALGTRVTIQILID